MLKLTGNEHTISSPYHPQTNGLDKRTNQTLTLIKFSEAKEKWDENIDAALYAYRIAKLDSSQFSPFFIMYNRMAIDHEFSCKATTNVTGENTCSYDMEETYGNLLAIREKYHQKVQTLNKLSNEHVLGGICYLVSPSEIDDFVSGYAIPETDVLMMALQLNSCSH